MLMRAFTHADTRTRAHEQAERQRTLVREGAELEERFHELEAESKVQVCGSVCVKECE